MGFVSCGLVTQSAEEVPVVRNLGSYGLMRSTRPDGYMVSKFEFAKTDICVKNVCR